MKQTALLSSPQCAGSLQKSPVLPSRRGQHSSYLQVQHQYFITAISTTAHASLQLEKGGHEPTRGSKVQQSTLIPSPVYNLRTQSLIGVDWWRTESRRL